MKKKVRGFEMRTQNLFLLAAMIISLGGFVSSETCTFSFSEIDTRDAWAPYSGNLNLDVFVNGKSIESFDVLAQKGLIKKSPSFEKRKGATVSLRVTYLTGTLYTVLVEDIDLECEGKKLRFSPWTASSGPSDTDAYGIVYGDGRLAFVFPRIGKVKSKDYIEFVSQPLEESPEISVSARDIEVSKPNRVLKKGDVVSIKVFVKNEGGLEGKTELSFFVDGVEREKVSDLFIQPGKVETHTFTTTFPGKIQKLEIRTKSNLDGRSDNNNAVIYLVEKPSMFFSDIKDTPAYKYQKEEPYKSWLTSLKASADRAKVLDYADEKNGKTQTICQNTRFLALAYQFSKDDSYAEAAAQALTHVGENGWTTYPTAAAQWGNAEKVLTECGQAYDWLSDYISASDAKLNTNRKEVVQDKLAIIEQSVYLYMRDMMEYDQGESKPRVFGDPGTGRVKALSGFVTMALALLDYNGEFSPQGGAQEWLEFALNDLLINSTTGGDKSTLNTIVTSGGHFGEVGYNHYFVGYLSSFLSAYKSVFGENLVEEYEILGGFNRDPVAIMLPDGRYPNEVSSWMGVFNDQFFGQYLAFEKEKSLHQWYINNVLGTKNCFSGCTTGSVDGYRIYNANLEYSIEKILLYDKYAPVSEPAFEGDPSYFNYPNGEAVFRSGWDKNEALYLYLKAPHELTIGGHGAADARQGSYELYAYGDYLLIDSGDNRFWDGKTGVGFGSVGHNSVVVDGKGLSHRSGSADLVMKNPAYLTETLASDFLDFAQIEIDITHLSKIDDTFDSAKIEKPIKWERTILFAENEFFVVLDEFSSDVPHDFELLAHYGSLKGESGNPKAHEDNFISGILELGGKEVDWKKIETKKSLGEESRISWETTNRIGETVKIDSFILPETQLSLTKFPSHIGDPTESNDFWHPMISASQSGKDVNYMTLHYPYPKSSSESYEIKDLTDKSKNQLGFEFTRKNIKDIILTGPEKKEISGLVTDAKILYVHLGGDQIEYFFVDKVTYLKIGSQNIDLPETSNSAAGQRIESGQFKIYPAIIQKPDIKHQTTTTTTSHPTETSTPNTDTTIPEKQKTDNSSTNALIFLGIIAIGAIGYFGLIRKK
ncbi:MAG: heparinase II/III family protein [Candidatus Altiarchaeota archaeon]